jgi:PBSX family phage portal protein
MSEVTLRDLTIREKVDTGTSLEAITKAMYLGEESGQKSAALVESEAQTTAFAHTGAIEPPYDPGTLALIYENSSALRPNIDAYITNIDSYGHTFKPIIDLEANDADAKIGHALKIVDALKTEPKESVVHARKELLRNEMLEEADRLAAFFDHCTIGIPFAGPEGLRGLTRMDLEICGNAYWEVLRNDLEQVAAFNRLPSVSMRIKPIDPSPVSTPLRRRTSLLEFQTVPIQQRFRRFLQKYEGQTQVVHFKEFGDPRIVSSKTGRAYESVELMQKETDEKDAFPATEVLHFKLTSPRTVYGIPRWVGVMLAVLGSRQAEEVNFLYFENRSVPPLAVLVSGGRLNQDSVKRLEDWISNNVKGKKNFHKILILEAESAGLISGAADPDNGRMKIVLQPLTAAQQKDGLFLEYDERNADKVGQSFRMPRLLRGDVRDFNKSTADASVDFAEIQVFGPIRQQFDWLMNQVVLAALDIKYHEFVSNAPTVRDPLNMSLMIKDLVTANVITPGEGRELAQQVFNRPFLKIKEAWTEMPVALTVSGRNMAGADPNGPGQGLAAGPLSIPGAGPTQASMGVGKGEGVSMPHIINKMHDYLEARERETLFVPDDIFHSWFAKPDA